MAESDKKEPITIKKYANRRLYNTSTSKYVTLDVLSQMVKAGDEFVGRAGFLDAAGGGEIDLLSTGIGITSGVGIRIR